MKLSKTLLEYLPAGCLCKLALNYISGANIVLQYVAIKTISVISKLSISSITDKWLFFKWTSLGW